MLSRFNADYFFSPPSESWVIWLWFGLFLVVLALSLVIYSFLLKKSKKTKPYKSYAKTFFWPNFSMSLIGLFFVFSRYEKLALFSLRFWIYLIFFIFIFYNVYFFVFKRKQLHQELLKFHNAERKQKWMPKSKK